MVRGRSRLLPRLLTTVAEYTTTWYHDDPTASHIATTAVVAQILHNTRHLETQLDTARIEQKEVAAARARDRSEETLRRYRDVAARLAPGPLEGRDGDLAQLTRFTMSEGQWWWWEAPPFAGKTALVARWVADFDEPDVRLVATFLRERSRLNTAGHVLSDWVNQLSAICESDQPGTGGPDELAVTSYAYERLRALIVAACRVSRRIVLVVDGLDEYNPEHPVEDWLPELELPSNAALLVTSRRGAPNGSRGTIPSKSTGARSRPRPSPTRFTTWQWARSRPPWMGRSSHIASSGCAPPRGVR